mmetsp:Transcript_123402/g.384043  ORF Transcript_123402/g.384043 Transcript_123402/m.384043 type:complete len:140 (-) Transcript_123402:130-549(-)
MLNMEGHGTRNDTQFINGGWELMMEAIRQGAAHIYYSEMRKKSEAEKCRAEMENKFKQWAQVAKGNVSHRDEFNARMAKEAAQRAVEEAKENEKAQEKAEKKARELRHQYRDAMHKKAAVLKQGWIQKGLAQPMMAIKV